jgi:hypothetical protein
MHLINTVVVLGHVVVEVDFHMRRMAFDAVRTECVTALVARKDDFFPKVAWHFAKGYLGLCRIAHNFFARRRLRASLIGFVFSQVFQLRFDMFQLGINLLSILLSRR